MEPDNSHIQLGILMFVLQTLHPDLPSPDKEFAKEIFSTLSTHGEEATDALLAKAVFDGTATQTLTAGDIINVLKVVCSVAGPICAIVEGL